MCVLEQNMHSDWTLDVPAASKSSSLLASLILFSNLEAYSKQCLFPMMFIMVGTVFNRNFWWMSSVLCLFLPNHFFVVATTSQHLSRVGVNLEVRVG